MTSSGSRASFWKRNRRHDHVSGRLGESHTNVMPTPNIVTVVEPLVTRVSSLDTNVDLSERRAQVNRGQTRAFAGLFSCHSSRHLRQLRMMNSKEVGLPIPWRWELS